MLTRIFDTYLQIHIILENGDQFEQCFDSSWKLKDALSWMYDIYCIEDNKISSQTCSYVKRYKLKNGDF